MGHHVGPGSGWRLLPRGGRANQEVAELLSAVIGSKVSLKTGIRGRAKVFEVFTADIDGVRRKLGI